MKATAAGGPRGFARTMSAITAALALVTCSAIIAGSTAGVATAGAASYQLAGVSCANASFCMAVGSSAIRFQGVDSSNNTLIERWNGKAWSVLTSPGGTGAALRGVSCTSAAFCVAVGNVLQRWNGTSWSLVTSPKGGGTLEGVSCTSATNCIAVGFTGSKTLVERWNGAKWSIIASPSPTVGGGSVLSAVSCTSAASCFAVGWNNIGGAGEPTTIVERFNGKTWSIDTNARPRSFSALNGVSCASATSCMAVGYSQTAAARFQFGPPKTLVQRWNGKTWSIVASPNPGTTNSELAAISCPSATSCIAVGQFTNASDRDSAFKTLVERWNGTAWSQVASPNSAGATVSQPAGVSCTAPTGCVAVGHYTTSTDPRAVDAGPFKTLAQKWNGAAWSIVAGPTPPAPQAAR